MFQPGDKLQHRFDKDLGPGEVVAVEGRRLRVHFPREGQTLLFSTEDHAFVPLQLREGADPERWFEDFHLDLVDRLARFEADDLASWENRQEGMLLAQVRQADGLGSFLGGRIRLFPHQLHVAEQAAASDPVRWLLADEVGLGKTVEACLVLNRLLRTGRAQRVVVVAPASLTVQWLGELYRKFHQAFVLLDKARLKDVRKDFGSSFNPFDAHRRTVVALEDLVALPELVSEALAAAPDLLVVDEAHRLEREPGHPGSPAYRAVAPLCGASRHALLLTATPLEADAHGFFRLLELLRPDLFGSWEAFRAALDAGEPLYPCASATRRVDIGGLPPRVPKPVELAPWPELDRAVEAALARPTATRLERRRRAEALERALAEPLGPRDPRLAWLAAREEVWRHAGEKALVFVHRREALAVVKRELEGASGRRVAVFHEDMSPAARDLEVAQFASPNGPTLLVSTEAGGEGRNFEFCSAVILFDLPWDPVLVEQRIGRLDRISRKGPVDIHYFVPAGGFGAQVARIYEALGVFREPLSGLDRSLGHVRESLVAACEGSGSDAAPTLDVDAVAAQTLEARQLVNRALYHDLYRHRYRPEQAEALLARIPPGLDELTSRVVREACRQYGFELEPKAGADTWYVEFGPGATVGQLPGVNEGSRWLGTFDREEAVRRETLDYFASGHPLVEGVLLELEDGHRGEVALLDIPCAGAEAFGLLALVKTGVAVDAIFLDLAGGLHPEWEALVLAEPPTWREADVGVWGAVFTGESRRAWGARVRELLQPLQARGTLVAVAGLRLLP
jgi:ATP-dependent helicase HepA